MLKALGKSESMVLTVLSAVFVQVRVRSVRQVNDGIFVSNLRGRPIGSIEVGSEMSQTRSLHEFHNEASQGTFCL